MSAKRLLAFGIGCIALFAVLQMRIFALVLERQTTPLNQSVATVKLDSGRAEIYDRNMRPLTGVESETMALALPGDSSYAKLYRSLTPKAAAELYAKQLYSPVLVSAENVKIPEGIYTCTREKRYFETPIAVHLIGYLDGDGNGASGIEKAYNDLLAAGGDKTSLNCAVTAAGGLIKDSVPETVTEKGTGLAVQLTIDERIQRICEGVSEELSSGSVVVLDVQTGQLLAMVSAPDFDPGNVAKSIADNDTSLLCRPLAAYSVGSVFKPLIAAAAMESGVSMDETYLCTGSITVADHEYHCASNRAHGEVSMAGALEQSCNCYFIQLAQQTGASALLNMAARCGFGRSQALWTGGTSAAGNLPTEEQLSLPGELASLGFGQGKLMATPVQVAAFYNTIANGGVYIAPTAVLGEVKADTGEIVKEGQTQETLRVMSAVTAKRLRSMLAGVVTDGLATAAAPEYKTAGGKTGTAQTGRYNEDGTEQLDAWFAGFYPVVAPQYTIVVLEDSTTRNGEALASVFARICDELERLDRWG